MEEDDDNLLFAPNGAAVGEEERELIRQAHEVWEDETGGDMTLAEFASKIFFGNCSPASADLDRESETAPAGIAMKNDETALLPVMERSGTLPMLAPVSTELPGLSEVLEMAALARDDVQVPVLERVPAPSKMPSMRRIAPHEKSDPNPISVQMPGLRSLSEKSAISVQMPGLRPLSKKSAISVQMPGLRPLSKKSAISQPMPERLAPDISKKMPGLRPLAQQAPDISQKMPGLKAIAQKMPGLKAKRQEPVAQKMPGLNPITAKRQAPIAQKMPGLKLIKAQERIAAQSSPRIMPGLKKISSCRQEGVPVLERVVLSNGPASCPNRFVPDSEIESVVNSVRGLGMTEQNVYARVYGRKSAPAPEFDSRARATLEHNFAVIRDNFAKDPSTIGEVVNRSSREGLLNFVAELRGALAGVESCDEECARNVGGACSLSDMLLDPDRLAAVAIRGSAQRATFISAAHALSEILQEFTSDIVQKALFAGSLSVGNSLQRNLAHMHEAWGAMLKRVYDDMKGALSPAVGWRAIYTHFNTVAASFVDVNKLDSKTLPGSAMVVWALIAWQPMMHGSRLHGRTGSGPWVGKLNEQLGMLESIVASKPPRTASKASSRSSTRASEKVKKGLDIIFAAAIKEANPNTRDRVASTTTSTALEPFVRRVSMRIGDDPEADMRNTIALFLSVAAGIILMRKVADLTAAGFDPVGEVSKNYIQPAIKTARDALEPPTVLPP